MFTPKIYHKSALEQLRRTILAVKPHQVTDIQPERAWPCLESYPCKGHGDAIITLDNGTSMRVLCDSVEIGALMWYFQCGSDHFTEYIDDEFASFLRENIAG
jgi:hypothetical protein